MESLISHYNFIIALLLTSSKATEGDVNTGEKLVPLHLLTTDQHNLGQSKWKQEPSGTLGTRTRVKTYETIPYSYLFKGMSKDDARAKYIEIANGLKSKYA